MNTAIVSVNGALDHQRDEFELATPDVSLIQRINSAHDELNAHARQSVTLILQVGGWLTECRKAVGKGEWTGWVKSNLRFSYKTAARYMKVWEHRTQLDIVSSPEGITDLYHKIGILSQVSEADLEERRQVEAETNAEYWAKHDAKDLAERRRTAREQAELRSLPKVKPEEIAKIEAEEREREQRKRATILFYQCVLLFDPCAMGIEALTNHLLTIVDLKMLPERLLKEHLQQCSTVFSAVASKWED